MVFIPLIDVLNISIILIMIIAFANSKKNNVILFQLVDHETIKDYNAYVDKPLNKNEKKLNVFEYHKTVYNLKAVPLPSSSFKSFEIYRKDLFNYFKNTYKDPEMASQEYNLKFLENTFNSFLTCLDSLDDILSNDDITLMTVPRIINEIKDILLDKKNAIGYKSVISTVLLKSKTTQTREEIIRQISKNLNDVTREKLLYTCILQFKNGVTEMNTTIGLYTEEYISSITETRNQCTLTQLSKNDIKFLKRKEISMDIESVELSTTLKRKILENEELEVLKRVAQLEQQNQFLNLVDEASHFYQHFTKIKLIYREVNSSETIYECEKSNISCEMKFRITKLSHMIYPSSSDNDLEKYKMRRHLMIKYLKLFGKYDNNHIYDKYTDENNKMTQNYFDLLKTCRAIRGETNYNTYVLRLRVIGCIPLPEQYWINEPTELLKVVK